MNEKFELEGSEFIELAQVLKIMGLVETGGHAKIVIQDGHVLVNGKVDTRRRAKLRSGDIVELEGQIIEIV